MADVSSTLVGWSPTSGSNNPQGTTAISTGLDDNLREIQGVMVRGLSYKGADISSATTTDLGAVEGLMHDITGTTTITSFGTVRAGIWKMVKFEGVLTLTHNATSLILPGGINITTADGDIGIFISEGSGNWRCVSFTRANSTPQGKQPTRQVFTSGTAATYTTPSGATRINVRMVGGGGGGGAQGTNAGSDGADTTFSTLTAGKGTGGGTASAAGGNGGTGTNGDINISGGKGAQASGNSSASTTLAGGHGGNGFFGGAGAGGINGAGTNAAANSGSGGGGGGGSPSSNAGSGGGAGAYVEKLITSPATTYTYTVGAGGNGGAAGVAAGGNGAAGIIIVDEWYD